MSRQPSSVLPVLVLTVAFAVLLLSGNSPLVESASMAEDSPPSFSTNVSVSTNNRLTGVWVRAEATNAASPPPPSSSSSSSSFSAAATNASGIPGPRQGHTATVVGDDVFIFGGSRGAHFEEVLSELWKLSVRRMSWTKINPQASRAHPPGLVGHTATPYVHRNASVPPEGSSVSNTTTTIFVIGGLSFCGTAACGGSRSTWHDTVWALDTRLLVWKRVKVENPNAKTGAVAFSPRQGHVAAISGSRIFVFGGFADQDSDVSTDPRVLVLDVSGWPVAAAGDGNRPLLRWTALNASSAGPSPRRHTGNMALLLEQHFLSVYNARATSATGVSSAEVASINFDANSASPEWMVQSFPSAPWIASDGAATSPMSSSMMVAYGGCGTEKCHNQVQVLRKVSQSSSGKSTWTWTPLKTQSATSNLHSIPYARAGHTISQLRTDPQDRTNAPPSSGHSNRSDFKFLVFGGCNTAGRCAGADSAYFLHVTSKPEEYVDRCDPTKCQTNHGSCIRGKCVVNDAHPASAIAASPTTVAKKQQPTPKISFVVDVACPGDCSGHGKCDHKTGRCTCSGVASAPSLAKNHTQGDGKSPYFGPSCAHTAPASKKVAVNGSWHSVVVPIADPRAERVEAIDYSNNRIEIDVPRAGPLLIFIPVLQSVVETASATAAAAAASIGEGHNNLTFASSASAATEAIGAAAKASAATEANASSAVSAFVQVAELAIPTRTRARSRGTSKQSPKHVVHLHLRAYEGTAVIVDCPPAASHAAGAALPPPPGLIPPPSSNGQVPEHNESDCTLRRLMMHSKLSSRGRFLQSAGPGSTDKVQVKFTHVSEHLQDEARKAMEAATQHVVAGAPPIAVTARTPSPASVGDGVTILIPSTGEVLQGIEIEWAFFKPPSQIAVAIEEGFATVGDWFSALGQNSTQAQRSRQLAAARRAARRQQDQELATAMLAGRASLVPPVANGPIPGLHIPGVRAHLLDLHKRYANGTEFIILQDSYAPVALPLHSAPCSCGGNGACNADGGCVCFKGWSGPRCQFASCPNNCTSLARGSCVRAKPNSAEEACKCNYGYTGLACNISTGCGSLGRSCGPHAECVAHRALLQAKPSPAVRQLHQHLASTGLLAPPPPHSSRTAAATAAGGHPDVPLVIPPKRVSRIVDEQQKKKAEIALAGAARDADFFQDTLHSCECHPGWAGPYCRVEACPNNCSVAAGQGMCTVVERRQQCVCKAGFSGSDCSQYLACEGDGRCSDHGVCERGNCRCDAGWAGITCAERANCAADHHCSGHGSCLRGQCACHPDYTGTACDMLKPCLHNCSGHGVCHQGVCACLPGFVGLDCSVRNTEFCPSGCSSRGDCFNGQCYCNPGFKGDACETEIVCPTGAAQTKFTSDSSNRTLTEVACSGHGICQYGKCFCDPGFSGPACASRVGPLAVAATSVAQAAGCSTGSFGTSCSAHGVCVDARCHCFNGFAGSSCELAHTCDPECGSQGVCLFGTCQCKPGWRGPSCRDEAHHDCTLQKPELISGVPVSCSGHGRCDASSGDCVCSDGWFGDACEVGVSAGPEPAAAASGAVENNISMVPASLVDRADCSMRCVHGECLATGGTGSLTATESAPAAEVYCSCEPGWRGAECNRPATCHANCSGHGFCHLGSCFCDPGFEGASCHVQRECPGGCKFGICVYGRCACIEGFTGETCSIRAPGVAADPLSSTAVSATHHGGQPLRAVGRQPSSPLVVNGLQPTQRLKGDVAFCPPGSGSGPKSPPCNGNGNCSMGECSCHPGWFGRACDQPTAAGPCPNRCSGRGLCDSNSGHCLCEPGWFGADCSSMSRQRIAAAAAECSEICGSAGTGSHGSCVNGSCVCEPGYGGLGCSVKKCPADCSNSLFERRGDCISGRCICRAGFGGPDCAVTCPNACSGHGACHSEDRMSNGLWQCYCEPGWYGDACDLSGAWYSTWPYRPIGGLAAVIVLALLLSVRFFALSCRVLGLCGKRLLHSKRLLLLCALPGAM
eukprot:INCI15692.1.p1 GENE.INCI15692.1~~INCI15692.1.p1  ORF type:complete len:1996 (+),score=190.66 INCI15692.1:245-6232(+)